MKVVIVSVICLIAALTSACHSATSQPGDRKGGGKAKVDRNHTIPEAGEASKAYGTPAQIAELEDGAIDESSGVVASRRNPDLFWTHNDSGDGPFLYAFDLNGGKRGTWHVTGAKAFDWEDIAAGPGSTLDIADIGDNDAARATASCTVGACVCSR